MDQGVKVLQKVDTVINADSVEFCPYDKQEHILLCGTYKLDENASRKETSNTPETQKRYGSVKVFSVCQQQDTQPLKEKDSINMCGVLDIKWSPKPAKEQGAVFGLVDAEGFLQILTVENDQIKLETSIKGKLSDSSLGLSLGWNGSKERNASLISCSDSAGCITVFELREDLNVLSQWSAHAYEAWITAFHDFDDNIIYSGGDDCLLKMWDLRDTSKHVMVSRRHQMGVCSIQSHPSDENIFATGSYDEHLLIWDRRKPKQPLTETSLGGGVWRIKWEPHQAKQILTATMYNGTHIIDCNNLGQNPLPVLIHYNDHNLAYGADWCRFSRPSPESCNNCGGSTDGNTDRSNSNSFIVSTCSFYDHSLHLWEWNTLQ